MFLFIVSLLFTEKLHAQDKTNKVKSLKYVRVYTDSIGESHFEDLEINLNEVDFAPPAPSIFTSNLNSSTSHCFLSVLPGWTSNWHPASKRQFVIYLSSIIEMKKIFLLFYLYSLIGNH